MSHSPISPDHCYKLLKKKQTESRIEYFYCENMMEYSRNLLRSLKYFPLSFTPSKICSMGTLEQYEYLLKIIGKDDMWTERRRQMYLSSSTDHTDKEKYKLLINIRPRRIYDIHFSISKYDNLYCLNKFDFGEGYSKKFMTLIEAHEAFIELLAKTEHSGSKRPTVN